MIKNAIKLKNQAKTATPQNFKLKSEILLTFSPEYAYRQTTIKENNFEFLARFSNFSKKLKKNLSFLAKNLKKFMMKNAIKLENLDFVVKISIF